MRTKTKQNNASGENGTMHFSMIESPLGKLMLVANDSALIGLYFAGRDHIPAASKQWKRDPQHPIIQKAEKQLQEYFAGRRKSFSLPLSPIGTKFQQKVWQEIALIPYGGTITYSELAKRTGSPAAIRAAGTSTGRNPISIIVPCHRVVGKNGSLRGFAGGLERKQHLLELEGSAGKG